jgi:hypothetical protein
MHIIRTNMLMNVSRVVFRRIIAHVFLSGLIIKFEILLSFSVQQPEVMHFHGTGALSFDSVIDNANGSSAVNVNWCWRLWMPKLVQGKTKDFGFLGIEEEGSQFSFSGGCSIQFEDGASDVSCAIQFDWITVNGYTAEEEITTGTAASRWGGEIQCIGIYVENHIGCTVLNCSIRMGPHVVEELVNLFLCFLSGGRLLCGNVGKSHQYGGVDSTCIVKEATNNLLDVFFTSVIKEGTFIGRCRCLIVFSVSDGIGGVGTMLWFVRHRMSITGQLFHDILGHGKINIALIIIPLEVDATIEITGLVLQRCHMFLFEGGCKDVGDVPCQCI